MKLLKELIELTEAIFYASTPMGGNYEFEQSSWYVWAWDGEVVIYKECNSEADAKKALPKIKASAKQRNVLFSDDQFKIDQGTTIAHHYPSTRKKS